ncbi:hypothetical protein [Microcoleus sp. herbarium5]|uniref:hypothetical protein n=1 Tax=Microcoleus sp. herbarium5 TaxID=3055434 RepID=UPI002FD49618
MNIFSGKLRSAKSFLVAVISIASFPTFSLAAYNQPHIVGSKIYFPNLPSSQKASIESLGKVRSPSANRCGVASASITTSNPWTTFTYGGQTYQLLQLETHTATHVCKIINGSPTIYIPMQ